MFKNSRMSSLWSNFGDFIIFILYYIHKCDELYLNNFLFFEKNVRK